MDKIRIKYYDDEVQLYLKNRHKHVDTIMESLRDIPDNKSKSDNEYERTWKESPSKIEGMSIYDKWSIWEFEDITKYPQMNDNFYDLKKVIDNGKTHFERIGEHPLLSQIFRHHSGIKIKGEDDVERSVLVSKSHYKNLMKKCLKNGSTTILNNYEEESTVRLINGKLIDDDGDREVMTQKMLSEMYNGKDYLFGDDDDVEMNPLMKKVIQECRRQGLSRERSLEIWLQSMTEITDQFKDVKNLDDVEIDLHLINKDNPLEVN